MMPLLLLLTAQQTMNVQWPFVTQLLEQERKETLLSDTHNPYHPTINHRTLAQEAAALQPHT